MRRFFFDPARRKGNCVTLDHEESRHITKVLRLEQGAQVELLDGLGRIYPAEITDIARAVTLVIGTPRTLPPENDVELILFQAVLKSENMDTAVQKATELGVRTMYPLFLSR